MAAVLSQTHRWHESRLFSWAATTGIWAEPLSFHLANTHSVARKMDELQGLNRRNTLQICHLMCHTHLAQSAKNPHSALHLLGFQTRIQSQQGRGRSGGRGGGGGGLMCWFINKGWCEDFTVTETKDTGHTWVKLFSMSQPSQPFSPLLY